jgi:hypothetical protein
VPADGRGIALLEDLFQPVCQVIQQQRDAFFTFPGQLASRHALHHELGDIHSQQEAVSAVAPLLEQFGVGITDVMGELGTGIFEDFV